MLMPIVSMNKMAMNESVAATCCYREMASPTNVYWEVMNGGWIGSGYAHELNWKSNIWKSWAQLGWDLDSTVSGFTYAATGTLPTDYPIQEIDAAGEKQWNMQTGQSLLGWLDDPINAALWKRGDACTHKDGTCNYKVEEVVYQTNRHFEATTKHTTGGDDWALTHEAKQFNS